MPCVTTPATETYYVINLNGSGNSYGSLVAFQNSADGVGGAWTSFGEGVAKNETSLFASAQNMVCAEYVNGVVFAQTDNGNLYGIPYDDFLAESIDLESTYIAHLDCVYQDLAYSYGQGQALWPGRPTAPARTAEFVAQFH